MTPEERQLLESTQNELRALRVEFDALKNKTSIPFEIDSAFRDRFELDTFSTNILQTSAKTLASETRAVDEGGTATYNVPKLHDGFIETTINGVIFYIPYYS